MDSGLERGRKVADPVNSFVKDRFSMAVINGRYKIYVDGLVMLSFNQLDFKGFYSFKDDHLLYCIDFYLKDTTIETSYKTKEVWLGVLKLLDMI